MANSWLAHRVRGERQSEALDTIAEETVTTRLTVKNGLRTLEDVTDVIYHQEEYLFRVAEEMSGIRQDIGMVWDQVGSNGHFAC